MGFFGPKLADSYLVLCLRQEFPLLPALVFWAA